MIALVRQTAEHYAAAASSLLPLPLDNAPRQISSSCPSMHSITTSRSSSIIRVRLEWLRSTELLPRTYVNPVLDADFPDPAVILAPDGFYYAYATQTLRDGNGSTSRSRARPTWSTGSISAMRFPKSRLGAGNAGLLGAERDLGRSTYFMYYSATPDVCHDPERGHAWPSRRRVRPPGPFVDMGMPLLLGVGFEYIDPMAYDDPATRQAPALLGIRLSADQGPGAARGPDVVRCRTATPIDLIWPNRRGRVPAARRGGVGDPPRRFLLSLLFGRQLLRAGRRIWRDGRPLARARQGRSRRSRRHAACRTA